VRDDPEVLRAALIGYQHQIDQIKQVMADLQRRLGKPGKPSASLPVSVSVSQETGGGATSGRRKLSAATRKRMAAGQKRRWAAYRSQQKAAKT